jgi:hypothetical protein
MKKILVSFSVVMALASMAMAQQLTKTAAHSYGGYLINEAGLTRNATYALTLPSYDGKSVGIQVIYSSVTFKSSTFTDGTQSTGSLTVLSTSSLSGVKLVIAGVTLTAGTDFPVGTSVSATASNLAQVINASSCPLSALMSAAAVGAVVTATVSVVGINYPMTTSNAAKVSLSGAVMTGGTGAYYSAATDIIKVPSHGFTKGLPVLYTQGAAIDGLTTGTTYYVIPIDANNIYLASSSVLAFTLPVTSNSYVGINTQRAQLTANTYTLAPLAISGTPGFYWQGSNDGGLNFFSVNMSSVTMSSYTSGGANVGFDFGDYNFNQLYLNVTGPTAGAISLKASAYVRVP